MKEGGVFIACVHLVKFVAEKTIVNMDQCSKTTTGHVPRIEMNLEETFELPTGESGSKSTETQNTQGYSKLSWRKEKQTDHINVSEVNKKRGYADTNKTDGGTQKKRRRPRSSTNLEGPQYLVNDPVNSRFLFLTGGENENGDGDGNPSDSTPDPEVKSESEDEDLPPQPEEPNVLKRAEEVAAMLKARKAKLDEERRKLTDRYTLHQQYLQAMKQSNDRSVFKKFAYLVSSKAGENTRNLLNEHEGFVSFAERKIHETQTKLKELIEMTSKVMSKVAMVEDKFATTNEKTSASNDKWVADLEELNMSLTRQIHALWLELEFYDKDELINYSSTTANLGVLTPKTYKTQYKSHLSLMFRSLIEDCIVEAVEYANLVYTLNYTEEDYVNAAVSIISAHQLGKSLLADYIVALLIKQKMDHAFSSQTTLKRGDVLLEYNNTRMSFFDWVNDNPRSLYLSNEANTTNFVPEVLYETPP